MNFINVIEKTLESSLFEPSLIFIPKEGLSETELDNLEKEIGRKLSPYHKEFLQKWNGINLEIIRLYGFGNKEKRIRQLTDEQNERFLSKHTLVIGSDPSGFIYLEDKEFNILCLDTISGETQFLARNLDDFFSALVFGEESNKFLGEEWKNELHKLGFL